MHPKKKKIIIFLHAHPKKKNKMESETLTTETKIEGGDRFSNALTGAAIGGLLAPKGSKGSGAIAGALVGSFLGGKSRSRSRSRSPRRKAMKKSRSRSKSSSMLKWKKYTTRKSPGLPANMFCGERRMGNNGKMWKSVSNKNGVCTWRPVK